VEAEWIARESGNLWAAMGWARNNAGDLGLGLAADLSKTRHGDLAQVRGLLEELLRRSSAKGRARVYALSSASVTALRQGDYEAALMHAEVGLSLAGELGDVEEVAYALHLAGCIQLERGDLARADKLLEEATSVLQDSGNRRLMGFIRSPIAYLATRRGDYTVARDILDECLINSRAAGDLYRTAYYLDNLAMAQRGLNDPHAAAVSWKEALSIQRGLKHQTGIIDSLEGLASVAEILGDDRRAVRLAAAATRMSDEMSYRYDSSMLVEDSRGRARARLGARESEKAWKEGWSMSLDRAAECALDESESETGVEAGPLSRREREVARLVAAGMTNLQIGEQLFISRRTVESHVDRIRNKLSVRSRTEVATWAAERGLMTDRATVEPGPGRKRETR
jgi:ATP/maltotriose-dependent transcriptional regulator MalT